MQTPQTIRLPEIPVHGADVFPQSFAQQRLWFMHQMEPGSAHYNAAVTITLQGRLDVDALRRALGEIVRRHEALRTVFAAVDGEPVQVVLPDAAVELPVTDLASPEPGARAAEADRVTRDEAARPFDLARGPLFRPRLLRLGASCPRCGSRPAVRITPEVARALAHHPPEARLATYQCQRRRCGAIFDLLARAFQQAS